MFAPLARLLGLYSIKEELEALSFSYSNPEEHAMVQRRLDCLAKEQEDVVLKVRSEGSYEALNDARTVHKEGSDAHP